MISAISVCPDIALPSVVHVIAWPIESHTKHYSQNIGPIWYLSTEPRWYSSDTS